MNGKYKWLYCLLSMVLCLTMLMGTTLAWSPSTTSGDGSIESGQLKIDFLKYNGTGYESVRESNGSIFDDGESKVYWSPGMTQILYLAVRNVEELSAKYQIVIDVNGLEENDPTFNYALFDGVQAGSATADALDATANLNVVERWKAIKKIDGAKKGTILPGTITSSLQGTLAEMADTDYFALAVHMDEDAGNEYAERSIEVNVTVEAVQVDGYFGEGPFLGTSVFMNQDFESNEAGIQFATTGYRRERVTEGEGDALNTYFLLENPGIAGIGEAHITMNQLTSLSDYVVYEFDFKVEALGTWFNLYASSPTTMGVAILKADNTFTFADQSVQLNLNQWYTFAIAVDYFEGTIDYYLDDELMATGPLNEAYDTDTKIQAYRIHRTRYGDFGNDSNTNDFSLPFKLGIDNIRVYDSMEPLEDLGEIVKVITMTDDSVFPDETAIINSLSGYTAVHKRNGLVFVNGEKEFLPTVPVTEGEDTMIVTSELASILGVNLPEGTAVTMDVEEFFTSVLGKTVVTDDTVYNGGMVIAGDTAYALPEDADELKALNDYLFFLRPTDDYLEELYNASSMKAVHPRIQATAEDFARIRQIYNDKSDPDIYNWAQQIIYTADSTLEKDPVFYELRDGSRLLGVSREVLGKMYAYGMAYQITQDQKYAERGFLELQAVCEFPDWHPSHALDVGEMAAAVAIGYDWLYEALTPEQRQIVEEGIYNNAFYDAMIMYQSGNGYMSALSYGDSNWCNVVSGGMTMAALSMLDVYPEVAFRILQHAVRASDNYLFRYAPSGAWYEGPGYWDYATTYMVKEHSALESVLGTDFRLGMAEGLETTADYVIDLQGDNGTFTIGDGMVTKIYSPEMFYLAEKYDNYAISTVTMEKCNRKFSGGEHLALCLLWYDPQAAGDINDIELDAIYYNQDNAVVSMHDTFESGNTTFAAIHAGTNNLGHAHLDAGSFVFESDGVRWVEELGQDNYNQAGYWDETDNGQRWQIFRMRAEAHSVPVINPTTAQDQEYISFNPITKFESKDRGTIVLTDLTDAYRVNATKLLRGLQFTDNRRSLVIRDEMTMNNADSEVYWFLLTHCDLEIEKTEASTTNSVTFTKDGVSMTMDIITNVPGVVSYDVASPLNDATIYNTVETVKRLQIYFEDVTGDLNITVKMTPDSINYPSDVADYNVNMSTWTIPDGLRPVPPSLDSLIIGGNNVDLNGYNITNYYLEGQLTEVPDITAICNDSSIDVEIVKGATLNDVTTITLTDTADATNKTIYTISFASIPHPLTFEERTSIPAVGAVASCTPQEANIPVNVIDANKMTKWAGNVAGNYITLDLQYKQNISGLAVLWQGSDGRAYNYVISVSDDGNTFFDVREGTGAPVSGESTQTWEFDMIDFASDVEGRYVRLTINGNSQSSNWTSIGEIVAYTNNQ